MVQIVPEYNDASRWKLREDHLLSVPIAPASQVAELRLPQLNVRPHVQHVALQAVDHIGMPRKLSRLILSDESRFENDLFDNARYGERGYVGVVGAGLALGGNGPLLGMPEGRMSHEDHRLVGGGTVTGHGYNLLCHLVNVDLGEIKIRIMSVYHYVEQFSHNRHDVHCMLILIRGFNF